MITFDGGLSLGDEAKRREDFPVGNDMKNGKWPSTSNEATGDLFLFFYLDSLLVKNNF